MCGTGLQVTYDLALYLLQSLVLMCTLNWWDMLTKCPVQVLSSMLEMTSLKDLNNIDAISAPSCQSSMWIPSSACDPDAAVIIQRPIPTGIPILVQCSQLSWMVLMHRRSSAGSDIAGKHAVLSYIVDGGCSDWDMEGTEMLWETWPQSGDTAVTGRVYWAAELVCQRKSSRVGDNGADRAGLLIFSFLFHSCVWYISSWLASPSQSHAFRQHNDAFHRAGTTKGIEVSMFKISISTLSLLISAVCIGVKLLPSHQYYCQS